MLIGVIADDFTGASDISNALAKGLPGQGGLRTAQFIGIPDGAAPAEVEAGVVALKSRSVPAEDSVKLSLSALAWLLDQGCRQIVFKYCSTFDSTPEGNIGPVGEALANALGVKGVMACPAFPTLGRTVHQGHLFVHGRLLNQSGLENHPINPMTDPDIRRWLGRQCADPVGLVPAAVVRKGHEAVRAALELAGRRGETLAIADAADDEDLLVLARAVADAPLLTGGSGIAPGLAANFIDRGLAKGGHVSFKGVSGGEAILAGSCSGATREQVALHAGQYPSLRIDVAGVMSGRVQPASVADFLCEHVGHRPLAFSSSAPAEVAALQGEHGRDAVSHRLDSFFAAVATDLRQRGVCRLIVAGGETSSSVTQALDLGELTIGPEIDPGVPILTDRTGGFALALKSGNFGTPDFFSKALERMENP